MGAPPTILVLLAPIDEPEPMPEDAFMELAQALSSTVAAAATINFFIRIS